MDERQAQILEILDENYGEIGSGLNLHTPFPGSDDPFGAVHRRACEYGDAGAVRKISDGF